MFHFFRAANRQFIIVICFMRIIIRTNFININCDLNYDNVRKTLYKREYIELVA